MRSDGEKEAGSFIIKKYAHIFTTHHQKLLELANNTWNENKTFVPIKISMAPKEFVPVTELLSSDNTLMTKVLSVLSSLCVEVIQLKKEAYNKHFYFLSVYEQYSDTDLGTQMNAICHLSSFVTRCDETLQNICSQVFAIFTDTSININGIQLHYVINHIGEIFTVLVFLETLISNTSLVRTWMKYCKTLKGYHQDPKKLNYTTDRFNSVLNAIDNITRKIMNDDIVQNTLHNLSQLRKNLIDKNSSAVTSEFTHYLKAAISNLDKFIQENPDMNNLYKCAKINTLFVLTTFLFGNIDKKIFRSLVELNTKAHSIYVIGNTIWFPEQFLQRHLAALCTRHEKFSQAMLKVRQNYMVNRQTNLNREATYFVSQCSQWVMNMEQVFSVNNHKLNATEMNLYAKILNDGLDIASQTTYSVLTLINLHLTLGIPIPKSMLMYLFEIIFALKMIKNAVSRNHNQIIITINMITQHLLFQAASLVLEVKKSLMSDKNYANNRLDELTCIVVAERALNGAHTIERIVSANMALSFIPNHTYSEDTYSKLGTLLEKIQALTNFIQIMDKYCNCSWLIWHQNITPIFFEQNFSIKLNALQVKYILMVLEDCTVLLHDTDKMYGMNKSKDFLQSVQTLVENRIIHRTSQSIETNLRLHIHSHLQLDTVNPFTFDMIKKLLLVADNFRIQCIYMSVVPFVEHYLSMMYYNLTTVVLSDWKTYGEMRQMARLKFNLITVPDHLPTQTLEQGLDVLEIMRNIHIFVSKYLYNLNNQIFIEKSSNNKHLNSINIKHIANSIRTHGIGVMNTTVNFTYQFLKKKFFTFSQFMFDEHIKSRLVKDLRYFKENANLNGNMYPYRNAEKFNKGIKTLGLNKDAQSYLDLFRELISEIGNAMGYVRMIRSGGRHCCSDATVFLPNSDVDKLLKYISNPDLLQSETIQSSEVLERTINGLITNFIQGTEYFKLLVDVFAPVFRNPKNVHLKNFYIIVPPLTLNFVEHIILSKDNMSKKNKTGAAFTDDGFSMGIAYILRLLDQDNNFEALHWFDSIWRHINDERRTLEEQKIKGSVQLQQALALTEKKIKTLEDEYKLLYYSLTSARIFFR